MPNGGVDFHGEHSRPSPKRNSLTTGRVLLRRGRSHRRRFVAYFVTALHKETMKITVEGLEPIKVSLAGTDAAFKAMRECQEAQ
jgi:hypothetical protein